MPGCANRRSFTGSDARGRAFSPRVSPRRGVGSLFSTWRPADAAPGGRGSRLASTGLTVRVRLSTSSFGTG